MHNLTEETLLKIFKEAIQRRSEGENIEFKDARGGIPSDLWKSISAFSNRPGGGIILFGIVENQITKVFNTVGQTDLSLLQTKIVSLIQQKIRNCGQYTLKIVKYDDKDLLALLISECPQEQKPCYFIEIGMPRGAYIRIGNSNRQISEEELRSFLRYSPEYKYDRIAILEMTLEMLSQEKINEYLDKSAKRTGRLFSKDLPIEKILKNLGILIEIKNRLPPTLAGCLIFSKDAPQRINTLSRYVIRCVRYAGTSPSSPIIDQQDIFGTLDQQIDESHKFILRNIAFKANIVGTKRVERYEYPEDAIREVLANALIHRDYIVTGTYIQVNIFVDRIEISNPGTLPPGVTVENLKESQFSRNEVIANLMRGLDYMEEFGRGIDLVYARMLEWNLVEPLFKNRSNMFRVTLLGGRFKNLNERQVRIWNYLQDNNQITASQTHELFTTISRATVNIDLKKMVEMELINVKGYSNNTYYEPKY